MALACFGLTATLADVLIGGAASSVKRRRQINSDQFVALIVAFHLWWILCTSSVLRSDSVRDTFCIRHVFYGELCENEGQDGFSCPSVMLSVKEKGKKKAVLKKVIQHKDALLCSFVAIGLMLFTLFRVMNIEPPAFEGDGDSSSNIFNMRIFPFCFGTTSEIDLFRDTDADQQASILKSVSTQLKPDFPYLDEKGIKKLHLARKTGTQRLRVRFDLFLLLKFVNYFHLTVEKWCCQGTTQGRGKLGPKRIHGKVI